MAKKKDAFVLTHTEIYALAIRSINADIAHWMEKADKIPEDLLQAYISPLVQKREWLKQLYKLECGNDYD